MHDIAANPAKGEPAHQYVDFRWIFRLRSQHAVKLQTEETASWTTSTSGTA
ncbi:hypothetical protein ABZY09_35795 [Streptomyces sp. NPDC002928]|uniref:hypothetical protein n=1 Tax=Streptomyces sp. NPDC002928 TaxID=3154440 RepID=UPI0033A90E08